MILRSELLAPSVLLQAEGTAGAKDPQREEKRAWSRRKPMGWEPSTTVEHYEKAGKTYTVLHLSYHIYERIIIPLDSQVCLKH